MAPDAKFIISSSQRFNKFIFFNCSTKSLLLQWKNPNSAVNFAAKPTILTLWSHSTTDFCSGRKNCPRRTSGPTATLLSSSWKSKMPWTSTASERWQNKFRALLCLRSWMRSTMSNRAGISAAGQNRVRCLLISILWTEPAQSYSSPNRNWWRAFPRQNGQAHLLKRGQKNQSLHFCRSSNIP